MDTTEPPHNLSAPDCLISDDANECKTLIIIRKVSASFSFVGCVFIIVLVIWKWLQPYVPQRSKRIELIWKYHKDTGSVGVVQRLILAMTVGALMDCISYFMNDTIADGTWCDFQAFWLTYFDWTVLLWVSCISFHLYLCVVRSNNSTDKYEKFYHLVCWSLPVLFSVLPFIHDRYGPAGAWCWIKRDNIGWRLGIWYVPLFTIIILMSLANLRIHRKLKLWGVGQSKSAVELWGVGQSKSAVEDLKGGSRVGLNVGSIPDGLSEKNYEDGLNHLRFYPLVYLLVSLFPLAHRICNAFDKDYFWLMVIASMCAPLHGVSNAIVFGLDKETREVLSKLCKKISSETDPILPPTNGQPVNPGGDRGK